MIATAYIKDIDVSSGVITLVAPLDTPLLRLIEKQHITEGELRLNDGRTIGAQQRKYIYAMLRDIADYTGHNTEELKDYFKSELVAQTGDKYISLSDCTVTEANRLINLIIEHILYWNIPTQNNLADFAPDIGRYVYLCLIHKKCCITGKKAELHHLDAVGMGRNRKEIIHKGMLVIPLCREKHEECHRIGKKSFCEKYKLYGIRLDNELCEVWKVKEA